MQKKEFASEIIDFCYKYQLLSKSEKIDGVKARTEENLGHAWFVESLINMLTVNTKYRKNIDVEKLKELLLEPEKIRLELEYNQNH